VIVAEPTATPVTSPVEASTEAVPEALVLHVPPPVASVNVKVEPTHIVLVPLIAATDGKPSTVTAADCTVVPQLLVTE
jgi:hypothetical protein